MAQMLLDAVFALCRRTHAKMILSSQASPQASVPSLPPSESQRLPRREYSRGEGQPAGGHPHLHCYDSGQRGCGEDAPAQGSPPRVVVCFHTVTNGAAPAVPASQRVTTVSE